MRARLNFVDFDGKPVSVELGSDLPITIGRSRDNTVMLRDEHASRMHARVHFEAGAWHVRDFGLNGTKLNGDKVDQEAEIHHGDELRIGDTRMRFSIIEATPTASATKRIVIPEDAKATVRLAADDLAVLSEFMTAAVGYTDRTDFLRSALDTILHQTNAHLAAFLSDDSWDPAVKFVVPETAKVELGLAKQLNRRLQKDGKTVWLCCDVADTRTPESLAQFSDALCLPVRTSAGRTHGALHVYRLNAYFTERDLALCEVIANYVANCLQWHRQHQRLDAATNLERIGVSTSDELVGDSAAMRELRQMVSRYATMLEPVLLYGETGAGKQLVALSLHRQGPRAQGPFVSFQCSNSSSPSTAAQLLGYRKSAIAGADHDQPGLFYQADEGTLYLEEVAALPSDAQAHLLRFLETRSFRPMGANVDLQSNIRIVVSSRRNLEDEVRSGKLRLELYDRLKRAIIRVPSLNDHIDDIPMIAQFMLDKLSARRHKQFRLSPAALAKLCLYKWPGNVRQLRSLLELMTVATENELLEANSVVLNGHETNGINLPLKLTELESWAVGQALEKTTGNKTKAAHLLGINRETLYAKIEKYGLDKKMAESVS